MDGLTPWILWEKRGASKSSFVDIVLQRSLGRGAASHFRLCVQKSRIERLDLSTSAEIRSSHYGGVLCLSLDAQECRYLLSGGTDGSIALYDLDGCANGGHELRALSTSHTDASRHSLATSSLEWYSEEDIGAFVSSSLDGRVLVWDTETMSVAGEFQLGAKVHKACTRAEAGRAVVACALSDDTIRLCDTTTMDSCHVLHGHKDAVTGVAWSPNNQHQLASCSCDGTLKVWDVRKGGSQGELMAFDWHQDHTATARGVFGGQAAAVGVAGRASPRIPGVASASALPLLRMDRSSEQAAKAHDGAIMSIKYSPCGNYLVSSGNDRKVRLWAADTGALAPINYDLPGNVSSMPYSMEIAAFSCSGDDLLLYPNGRSGDIAILPLHSPLGRPIKTLKGHVAAVTAIVYRATLNQIISASRDGMIYLWDATAKSAATPHLPQNRQGPGPAFQVDAWSDDDDDADPNPDPGRAPPAQRYFIPPIVRAYLDDSRQQRRASDVAAPTVPVTPGASLRVAYAKRKKKRSDV